MNGGLVQRIEVDRYIRYQRLVIAAKAVAPDLQGDDQFVAAGQHGDPDIDICRIRRVLKAAAESSRLLKTKQHGAS